MDQGPTFKTWAFEEPFWAIVHRFLLLFHSLPCTSFFLPPSTSQLLSYGHWRSLVEGRTSDVRNLSVGRLNGSSWVPMFPPNYNVKLKSTLKCRIKLIKMPLPKCSVLVLKETGCETSRNMWNRYLETVEFVIVSASILSYSNSR